jgi:hypothetical protein
MHLGQPPRADLSDAPRVVSRRWLKFAGGVISG